MQYPQYSTTQHTADKYFWGYIYSCFVYSPESKLPLNEFLELVRPSTCGFDNFGVRVDQMVFDEVQARFNVSIFKLDKVQACSDLFLHRYFIELVAGSLLGHRWDGNTEETW